MTQSSLSASASPSDPSALTVDPSAPTSKDSENAMLAAEAPVDVKGNTETVPAQSYNYTKLAMRNMVRKKGTSLKHFFLTLTGLLALLIGLSYLTR
jgi:hypothetical protein